MNGPLYVTQRLFGATAGLNTSLTSTSLIQTYSVLDLLQVYHHLDDRRLDSAVAPTFLLAV